MTKQSNFFQRIVAGVEHQLAREGVRVTESAEILEPTSDAKREVDVLIEGELNGHPIKVAVECRDHTNPQDVNWIDGLVGKYRDVNISLVVAASTSGFTSAALTKAKNVGIQTIHFAPVSEDDPLSMPPFQLRLLNLNNHVSNVIIRVSPPLDSPIAPELNQPIYDQRGNQSGVIRDLVKSAFLGDVQTAVRNEITRRTDELLKQQSRLHFTLSLPYTGSGVFIHDHEGKRYEIIGFVCEVAVSVDIIPASGSTYQYNRERVYVGTAQISSEQSVGISVLHLPTQDVPFRLAHMEVSSATGLKLRGT